MTADQKRIDRGIVRVVSGDVRETKNGQSTANVTKKFVASYTTPIDEKYNSPRVVVVFEEICGRYKEGDNDSGTVAQKKALGIFANLRKVLDDLDLKERSGLALPDSALKF